MEEKNIVYISNRKFDTTRPSNRHFKDLSGTIFNNIEVIEYIGKRITSSGKMSKPYYRCKCLNCGREYIRESTSFGKDTKCKCIPGLEECIGLTYGKLTIIDSLYKQDKHNKKIQYFRCRCKCGNIVEVPKYSILRGITKSCGCLKSEVTTKRNAEFITHGKSRSRIYRLYYLMRNRCYDKSHKSWNDYGGRGIKVCNEWMEYDYENKIHTGFNNFYNWAINNGYSDDLSIDRIDENGNYEPSNCRWVSNIIQSNNRRNTLYIGIKPNADNDIIYCFSISLWEKILNAPKRALYRRLTKNKNDWTVYDALTKSFSKDDNNSNPSRIIYIPPEFMEYNRPDKYDESIHD